MKVLVRHLQAINVMSQVSLALAVMVDGPKRLERDLALP